jgi:hypothetical protein
MTRLSQRPIAVVPLSDAAIAFHGSYDQRDPTVQRLMVHPR